MQDNCPKGRIALQTQKHFGTFWQNSPIFM